jgi:hypothetical protein
MKNLENTIVAINRQALRGEIWIDGSFLTEKLNPDDADIALVMSRVAYGSLTPSQRQFFNDFRGTSMYDQYRIDNYGIVLDLARPEDQWMLAYWLRQFGFSRASEMKGIVRVAVPFVVTVP